MLNSKVFFFVIVVCVFLADRLSKLFVSKVFCSSPYWGNFVSIVCIENKGAAFSLFSSGNPFLRKFLLIIVPVLIVLWIFDRVLRKKDKNVIAFSLISGGALGNLYDRILHGKVLDFIDIHINGFHYPAFNLADVFVFVGCVIVGIEMLKNTLKFNSRSE